MAEIKIEEKRGVSPLWWILGLLVLAALAWWLLAGRDRGDVADAEPVGTVGAAEPAAGATTGAVTDLALLTGGAGAADLVGRNVRLENVPVQSVVSDRGFWVGSGEGQRAFVIRANQTAPGTPPDGAVDAGQQVSIFGMVERMPTDLTQQSTEWNLRSTDSAALSAQPIYVRADSLRIVSR